MNTGWSFKKFKTMGISIFDLITLLRTRKTNMLYIIIDNTCTDIDISVFLLHVLIDGVPSAHAKLLSDTVVCK